MKRKGRISYSRYYRDEDYQKFEDLFRNIFQKRYQIVTRFCRESGKVLEVGASAGVMLNIFKSAGWQTWGVEPSAAAEAAKKRGIKISKTTFEKARLPNSFFDVVIINHTLEHMDNPLKVMQKIFRVLRPGGLVLVDVPNFGGFKSLLLKQRWPYLLPYEHNFQFTQETLKKLFEKAGFETIYTESRSGIYDLASPFRELWESLTTFKKRFFSNFFYLPIDWLLTAINMGDTLTLVGKKPQTK